MTIYQLINDENNFTTIIKLIRNKIITNVDLVHHISMYDKFYQMTGTKTERYKLLSKEYQLHPKTVQKIITKLNRKSK